MTVLLFKGMGGWYIASGIEIFCFSRELTIEGSLTPMWLGIMLEALAGWDTSWLPKDLDTLEGHVEANYDSKWGTSSI